MKKKVLSVLLAMAAAGAVMGCSQTAEQTTAESPSSAAEASSEETEETAKDTEASEEAAVASDGGTFTVGFDADFPPMGFKAEDGTYTGFDLDLAAEAAERLGLTFVAQPIAWDAKDMELDSGTIDCIWNGFTVTGREDKYTWTDDYMNNDQVFVVLKDSGITSIADLAGKIVEVQADSSAEAALKEKQDLTETFEILQAAPNYNQAFMDLEMGTVDAIAMDSIVANYQLTLREDVQAIILDDVLSSETYAVGFKLGNTELRDKVQAVLEEMAEDGTMKAISEKWFGTDITTIGK
ncbi:amino acid ABC transporter substrate-binding protein [Lachnospiraceae bacterium 62-35]